jgi:hypothetical protein
VQTVIKDNQFEITANGLYYSVKRTVRKNGNRVDITDAFQNPRATDVGIILKNYARLPSVNVNHSAVYLGGIPIDKADFKHPSLNLYTNTVAYNPTFFAGNGPTGIGIHGADEIYRAHARETLEIGAVAEGGVVDNEFLLRAGTSYTRSFSVYPVVGDYYDFINRVRANLNLNYTTETTSITLNLLEVSQRGYLARRTGEYVDFWNEDLSQYFNKIGAKQVILTQTVTTDGRLAFGPAFLNEISPEEEDRVRRIVERIHASAPGVKTLFYLDRWVTTESNALAKYPDSKIVYTPQGHFYQSEFENLITKEPYMLYGMRNDAAASYMPMVQKFVDKALSLGVDGIYFDELDGLGALSTVNPLTFFTASNYVGGTDTHSADINATTFEIATRKSYTTLDGKDLERDLIGRLAAAGRPMMANGGSPLVAPGSRFTHFVELLPRPDTAFGPFYEAQVGYNHLSTPVVYSYDGYDPDIAASIRKYLSVGGLYNYSYVPFYQDNNIMQKMYPFTPMELHAGYVIGTERTLTTLSGEYGYNDTSALRAFVYDVNGHLLRTDTVNYLSGGRSFISVNLGADQTAVIVRN